MDTLQSLRLFVTNKWKLILDENIKKFSSNYHELNTIDTTDCSKQIENILYKSCKNTKLDSYMYCQVYIYVYLTDLFTKQHNETFLLHIYNCYIKNNIRDIVHCNEYIIKNILEYKCESDTEIKKFISKIIENVKNISEYMFIDFKKSQKVLPRPLKEIQYGIQEKKYYTIEKDKQKELREKELREKELREKELREKELREKELREKFKRQNQELEQQYKQELEKTRMIADNKKKDLTEIEKTLLNLKNQQLELNSKMKEQLDKQTQLKEKLEKKLKEANSFDKDTEQKLRKQLEINIEQQFKSLEQQKSDLQKKILEKEKTLSIEKENQKILNEQLKRFQESAEKNKNELQEFMKKSIMAIQQESQLNNGNKNLYKIDEINEKLNNLMRKINTPKNFECCDELKLKLDQIQNQQKKIVNIDDMKMFQKSWEELFSRVNIIGNLVSNMKLEKDTISVEMLDHQRNMKNLLDKMTDNMNNKLNEFGNVLNKLETKINKYDNTNIQTQLQPFIYDIKNVSESISKITPLVNDKFNMIQREISNQSIINTQYNEEIKNLLGFFEKFKEYIESKFTQNIQQISSEFQKKLNLIEFKPESLQNTLNEIAKVVIETENKVKIQLNKIEQISKPLALPDYSTALEKFKEDIIQKLETPIIDTNYITKQDFENNFRLPLENLQNSIKSLPLNMYDFILKQQKQYENNEIQQQKIPLTLLEESSLKNESPKPITPIQTVSLKPSLTTEIPQPQMITLPVSAKQSNLKNQGTIDKELFEKIQKRNLLNKFICENKIEEPSSIFPECLKDEKNITFNVLPENLINKVNEELKNLFKTENKEDKIKLLIKYKILFEIIYNLKEEYTDKNGNIASFENEIKKYVQEFINSFNDNFIDLVNQSQCCIKNINYDCSKCEKDIKVEDIMDIVNVQKFINYTVDILQKNNVDYFNYNYKYLTEKKNYEQEKQNIIFRHDYILGTFKKIQEFIKISNQFKIAANQITENKLKEINIPSVSSQSVNIVIESKDKVLDNNKKQLLKDQSPIIVPETKSQIYVSSSEKKSEEDLLKEIINLSENICGENKDKSTYENNINIITNYIIDIYNLKQTKEKQIKIKYEIIKYLQEIIEFICNFGCTTQYTKKRYTEYCNLQLMNNNSEYSGNQIDTNRKQFRDKFYELINNKTNEQNNLINDILLNVIKPLIDKIEQESLKCNNKMNKKEDCSSKYKFINFFKLFDIVVYFIKIKNQITTDNSEIIQDKDTQKLLTSSTLSEDYTYSKNKDVNGIKTGILNNLASGITSIFSNIKI